MFKTVARREPEISQNRHSGYAINQLFDLALGVCEEGEIVHRIELAESFEVGSQRFDNEFIVGLTLHYDSDMACDPDLLIRLRSYLHAALEHTYQSEGDYAEEFWITQLNNSTTIFLSCCK